MNSENKQEILTTKHADVDQHHHHSKSQKERILDSSLVVDVPDIKIGTDDQLRKKSALLMAFDATDDNEVIQLNAKVEREDSAGAFNQDSSNPILDKLFGNALTPNGGSSSSAVEVMVEDATSYLLFFEVC